MSTPRRAAEILNHYLAMLFEAQGLTWSRENQQDIVELVKGLASSPPSRPSVPPAPAAAPRPAQRANGASSHPSWLEEV